MRFSLSDLFASIPPHQYDSFARVSRCSWTALGGPDEALLSLPNEGDDLEAYMHLLGQPVEIFTGSGSKIWWGYISTVQKTHTRFPQAMDLEQMANRVCAGFEELEPGIEPGLFRYTAWFENLPSQTVYGVKEKFLSLGMVGMAQANQIAGSYLNAHAWPELKMAGHQLNLKPSEPTTIQQPPSHIELVCHGWAKKLSWRVWQTKSGNLGHAPIQVGVQKLGETAANQKIAQSVKLDLTQDVSFIKLRLRKEGNPTDMLTISIQSDGSGTPSGNNLASASLNASSISAEGYSWCQVSFSALPKLTAGVPYWLVVQRSGALNSNAFYWVGLDENAGYALGTFRVFNSSNGVWSSRTPLADLIFKFGLLKATDELIQEAFDTVATGFNGLQQQVPTGMILAPFMREPMDGLSAFQWLLKLGQSDLNPLLMQISPTKVMRVYPRPDPSSASFLMDATGNLCDRFGNASSLEDLPIGQWVLMDGKNPVFIQHITWHAESNQISLNY